MKKYSFFLLVYLFILNTVSAQNTSPAQYCFTDEQFALQIENDPYTLLEQVANETFTRAFLQQLRKERSQNNTPQITEYTIPVVLHVFHNGDDGKIDMDQAQSGIDIINTDFNGLNNDWNTIDPEFDSIKATLNIHFCLASIDPDGNPTTGVNYYDDEDAMYNIPDLFQYAWDNYKYLNIYLPKYTGGAPSNFTAYAYYPNTNNSNNNRDGIFYSSIRWGYGTHSELNPGDEWASVGTHEVGHWLNLRHTFDGGCDVPGDLVDDTPPTKGGTLYLTGCDNNDLSCGVHTNGENYLDYNIDCKKMFTQGQVDRMKAALNLPSRIPLWSPLNLMATGCASTTSTTSIEFDKESVRVFPNPATDHINFLFEHLPTQLRIFNAQGKGIFNSPLTEKSVQLNTTSFEPGFYMFSSVIGNKYVTGTFIVH